MTHAPGLPRLLPVLACPALASDRTGMLDLVFVRRFNQGTVGTEMFCEFSMLGRCRYGIGS